MRYVDENERGTTTSLQRQTGSVLGSSSRTPTEMKVKKNVK